MNISHLRYAIEVEKTGSISSAAQSLYMAQPHLSRAIRELEDDMGITIFSRTSKGVTPTKKGKDFLDYAKSIINQIDEMESMYKPSSKDAKRFDICVPRASYISYAFIEFMKEIDFEKHIDINYRETNSMQTIKNVSSAVNSIGIIRYQTIFEEYFLNALKERDLDFKVIWEFEYLALMSKKNPLANEDVIDYTSLRKYTEIVHGDLTVPALPISMAREMARVDDEKKKISIYERGSQFELLNELPSTFMWVSPVPEKDLKKFNLVQKKCNMSKNKYKDLLIFKKGYKLTSDDEAFVKILKRVIDEISK